MMWGWVESLLGMLVGFFTWCGGAYLSIYGKIVEIQASNALVAIRWLMKLISPVVKQIAIEAMEWGVAELELMGVDPTTIQASINGMFAVHSLTNYLIPLNDMLSILWVGISAVLTINGYRWVKSHIPTFGD